LFTRELAVAFEVYAQYYDALYLEKDYEAECEFVEGLFQRYGVGPLLRNILDLGCGTGGHVLPLARRGYQVTGVDRSPEMLRVARQKAAEAGLAPEFVEGDIRDLALGREFDAVISMFAAVGYQTTNDDLVRALRTARRHLTPGGLFVFDVWFGPAVLAQRPSDRYRIVERGDERIVRFAHPELDIVAQVVRVNYVVWHVREGRLLQEVEETHPMRFFFVQEVAHYLETSGFQLLHACPFMAPDRALTDQDWNMAVVAQAV
jgi:SAM-dependent methyltransferase